MKYLNTLGSVVNPIEKDIENREKWFANASGYLETWDDSDSITAVKCQKIWDMLQKWWHNHSEAQYQGFEIKS